jgi:putative transcriptional regulator
MNKVFLNGGKRMRAFSYKKLFKKLIDLDMTNNELMEKANISKSTFYKIKNGQNVTTDVLLRICNSLECNIEDIIEINDIKEVKLL